MEKGIFVHIEKKAAWATAVLNTVRNLINFYIFTDLNSDSPDSSPKLSHCTN
jgi:hypothetical protein